MLVGLDFDNTIVDYQEAIAALSDSIPNLPKNLLRSKINVRNFLREGNREPEWTAFQGEVYGPGMKFAKPYPEAISCMKSLQNAGHSLVIISHRSRHPYAGPMYDLHAYARSWIADHLQSTGLFARQADIQVVNFLETKTEKIEKISSLGCNVFLDDLPELLLDTEFPMGVHKYLFDPHLKYISEATTSLDAIKSWSDFRLKIIKK